MEKREKRCVGSHIRNYDDLEDLILFVIRFFNHKEIKYTTVYNQKYDYYDLYFWLYPTQYDKVCEAYRNIPLH